MAASSGDIVIFTCEGVDHEIALIDAPQSSTLSQLRQWLPAEITIHCAKIAGCHIYTPSPILAGLEDGADIHTLQPGAFLYYPDRQYLEIIFGELQAETAAVNYLGQMVGDVAWLCDFAERQRRDSGRTTYTAHLRLKNAAARAADTEVLPDDPAWLRIRHARLLAWQTEPAEVADLVGRSGLNIPFGPIVVADGYFRFVQESLWQLWRAPDRFDDDQQRAAALNALELGIARIGGFCHMAASTAVLADAVTCIEARSVPLQALFAEVILYCSRLSNWVDLRIPWWSANELTKKFLGRTDYQEGIGT